MELYGRIQKDVTIGLIIIKMKTRVKRCNMKTIILILAVMFMATSAIAEVTYTAVTPDGKESSIEQIKVKATETIPKAELDVIKKWKPDFEPKSEMLRLEQIDKEIADLTAQKAKLDTQISEKQAVRAKVFEAAGKVELKRK